LYRQIVQWCKPESSPEKPLGKNKPTTVPSPTAVPTSEAKGEAEPEDTDGEGAPVDASAGAEATPSEGQQEDNEGESSEDVSEEQPVSTPTAAATSTPAPTPQPERHPSTELVDAVSRLSQGLYELEPGFGNTFFATQKLSEDLLGQKDLTPAERDYYSIFSAYLLSAWEGRPGSPLDPRVRAKEDVSELFQ
jgi:hypothetical protein